MQCFLAILCFVCVFVNFSLFHDNGIMFSSTFKLIISHNNVSKGYTGIMGSADKSTRAVDNNYHKDKSCTKIIIIAS